MLKKRVIPVLLLSCGRMVKGRQFKAYREVGNAISAARIYNAQNADELIFLDIDKSRNKDSSLIDTIGFVSKECFMPLSVGGGIRTLEDIRGLLLSGADKVVICTAAVENPAFIKEASTKYGKQCISVCIDIKKSADNFYVYSHCGTKKSVRTLDEMLELMQKYGAGEIIINSIDRDGMMEGYDIELMKYVDKRADIPVIAMGGAGNFSHLEEAFKAANSHAVACASIFHFGDNNPIRARSYLKNVGIDVKKVK